MKPGKVRSTSIEKGCGRSISFIPKQNFHNKSSKSKRASRDSFVASSKSSIREKLLREKVQQMQRQLEEVEQELSKIEKQIEVREEAKAREETRMKKIKEEVLDVLTLHQTAAELARIDVDNAMYWQLFDEEGKYLDDGATGVWKWDRTNKYLNMILGNIHKSENMEWIDKGNVTPEW